MVLKVLYLDAIDRQLYLPILFFQFILLHTEGTTSSWRLPLGTWLANLASRAPTSDVMFGIQMTCIACDRKSQGMNNCLMICLGQMELIMSAPRVFRTLCTCANLHASVMLTTSPYVCRWFYLIWVLSILIHYV